MVAVNTKIQEIAGRIRELREVMGHTVGDMAALTGISEEEYAACESGQRDLSFAFLYLCAQAFRVDVTDIIQGQSPTLKSYSITRAGEGQLINRAHDMEYFNLAGSFRKRIADPLYVNITYVEGAERRPIEVTTHEGQECDIVLKGTMKLQVGEHVEILHEGDCAYYDSSTPHGMIAVGGKDCVFYAIVLTPNKDEESKSADVETRSTEKDNTIRVWNEFVEPVEDEKGCLKSISFKNTDRFNFAFDVVDRLGQEKPDKTAILHVSRDHTARRITFGEMKRASAQTANYFKSLGIKKGDRVMLILKRHYQYWFCVTALHKIGAIAIPAMCQLLDHDIEYRFNAAGVSTIICTADGDTAHQVELACARCPQVVNKILVGGKREGWRDYDEEYQLFSGRFPRTADTPCGDDLMLMYFTSGTTGYPKMAAHSYKYPLGHFVTAKYWQCVNPEGLHLTISDTGWAKAGWGKIYGQWLCEGGLFVYDFDRFDAHDILPMFAQYHITTFCAPPTMLRLMVKEDISKYDLSSIEHMTTAGEALNPEVFRQFKAATGLNIMEGFGQTETTVIVGNLEGTKVRIGSMGKANPQYDVDIVDPQGNSVPVGENGEIVIRTDKGAPCGLLKEYYKAPDKTLETWHDGMYHTGDVAWRDEDGYFWYVGRIDDVIKSSGYRIGPFEIESVIMELPYVLECGVSAAPDPVRGQVVKASIVLTKGTEGTEELKKEIQAYVKEHTAPYKYPRIVVFLDSLPKTTSGKIQRNKL